MTTRLAVTERAALCDLLVKLGPDEPTLCAGWLTRDLAAHVVLREGRPDAAGGIVIKALAGYTAKVQRRLASGDYRALVDRLRDGPPRWSPLRIRALDEVTNNVEFFVHHEDIRRAQPQWQPRDVDSDTDELLWKRARRMAGHIVGSTPGGVDIVRSTTGERRTVKKHGVGADTLTLTGTAQELLLYMYGRRSHALVTQDRR